KKPSSAAWRSSNEPSPSDCELASRARLACPAGGAVRLAIGKRAPQAPRGHTRSIVVSSIWETGEHLMPRPCTVCLYPDRASVDAALVTGTPTRRIAAQYGLAEGAVRRHAEAHWPGHLAKAHQAQDVAQADGLLAQGRARKVKAQALLERAE